MTALRLVSASVEDGADDDLVEHLRWAAELRGLRPNTIRSRRWVLERLSLFVGGRPLRRLREADLRVWERDIVSGLAPESRRAYISHVRAFYAWAVKAGLVADDPTGCLTQPKLVRGLPRPMAEDDLRLVVAAAGPKLRLMVLLGAFCGLRCQEIAGLHWSDLNTTAGESTLLVQEGKGGKERVVPVPQVVLDAMNAYGRRRSGPVFYGRDARQLSPNTVSATINYHLRKLGVGGSAHTLRHRYATTAYRLSKDIRMVQELLGHSSPQTTARYAAYDKSQTAAMVAALDAQWTGAADD